MKNELLKDEIRQQFLDASQQFGRGNLFAGDVGVLCPESTAEHPKAEEYTDELIDLMPKIGRESWLLAAGRTKAI